jgi:LPS-assembly protein
LAQNPTQQTPAQQTPAAQGEPPALPASSAPQSDTTDLSSIPHATTLPPETPPNHAVLESDTQSRHGDIYLLAGDVEIDYQDHILRADTITYNAATGDTTAQGHLRLTGGPNGESIQASHGTYNILTQTGQFYDVAGSVEMRPASTPVLKPTNAATGVAPASRSAGFISPNPFLFDGRLVVKTGPESYVIYNGSVTSCLLPHPDWQLYASKFTLADGKASATGSTFKLLGIPVLFLPVVTHPTNADQRESGLLIPVFGYSSASNNTGSKGFTFGEQLYLTLGRSADLTAGALYYSLRGFSENGTVRYRGPGDDFLTAHFSALQDRGFYSPLTLTDSAGVTTTTEIYNNQGGQDVTAAFRRQFSATTRLVGDIEYLSSYIYREAFTENFNQAVSSDITSIVYLTREKSGYVLDARADRYEGLKVVPINTTAGEEVKIFHVPSLDFTGVDHHIGGTPLLWSLTASATGLKRVQPHFATSGITERVDLRPEISLPLRFDGWHILASVAAEETAYSRSRVAPYGPNAKPIELTDPLNRADVDVKIDMRPPAIERTFTVPNRLQWLLGAQVRHTVEPDLVYRNVHGVDNFLSVLRFDDKDLVSDTDELQYGATQHLYFRPRIHPLKPSKPGCPAKPSPTSATPKAEATATQATEPTGDSEAPDVFTPSPHAINDANGIPNASADAPDSPLRNHSRTADPCAPTGAAALPPQQEWFSWLLAQKIFIDPSFGGAVIDRRRNIFTTTLDLSGIAFLTEPRNISPLLSRMRFRTSGHADLEWDFDYDTGAKKFTSQNIFLDVHQNKFFGGFAYARLNAPGRFYTEIINTTTNTATGLTSSAVSNFSQMRFLLGYGVPTRPGLSAGVSAGIDLNAASAQYVTVQTSYNWNCCGLSVEYRKYDLGTIRDEGTYSFNFTLANIGSAGNLRRAEQLF